MLVLLIILAIGGYVFWIEVQRQLPSAYEFEQLVRTRYGQSRTDEHIATETPTEDDDPVLGPTDAPVTIIAFEDYECPYSGSVWRTEKQIMQEFDGQVKFVYRDFPITSLHANAVTAAEAAECAGDQDEYWAMHDLLFSYQNTLDSDTIESAARSLDLDMQQFTTCLESHTHQAEVMADYLDGVQAGVSGTPTYFFNGIRIEGALPIEIFRKGINYFIQ